MKCLRFLVAVLAVTGGNCARLRSLNNGVVAPSSIPAGRLFFYLEAAGFNVPELSVPGGGLPPASAIQGRFSRIAVVANMAGEPQGTEQSLLQQWEAPIVTALSAQSSVPVERWVSFCCFDGNGFNYMTTFFPLDASGQPTNPLGIHGIAFDNEGVALVQQVVQRFEALQDALGIELGWSLAPGTAKNFGPRFMKIEGGNNQVVATRPWNVSLGQAYTEGTPLEYYASTGCAFSPSFWQSVGADFGCPSLASCTPGSPSAATSSAVAPAERGVPMVCGAGNCQEAEGSTPCFDERMSGAQIGALIASRPADFPWGNFAVWYGTGQQPFCLANTNCFPNSASEQQCMSNPQCQYEPDKAKLGGGGSCSSDSECRSNSCIGNVCTDATNCGQAGQPSCPTGICVEAASPTANSWGCAASW